MKFLVAYDGSEASNRAIEIAKLEARAFSAKMHIFTTTTLNRKAGEEYEAVITRLEKIKKDFENLGIDSETNLISGTLDSGEEMVKFVAENSIDKIIIGIRKRSKVGKLLMGSASQYVILEASCPVLVVK